MTKKAIQAAFDEEKPFRYTSFNFLWNRYAAYIGNNLLEEIGKECVGNPIQKPFSLEDFENLYNYKYNAPKRFTDSCIFDVEEHVAYPLGLPLKVLKTHRIKNQKEMLCFQLLNKLGLLHIVSTEEATVR